MGIPFSKKPAIKIFEWCQHVSKHTIPLDHCPHADAMRLVENGLARWCLKGFAIQFFEPPAKRAKKIISIEVRGISCQMGPRVTLDAADDSSPTSVLSKEAALAYLVIRAGSYCPLIPR